MFLPSRRFIIGDEDFYFYNSQPSVIPAALMRTVSVSPTSVPCRSPLGAGHPSGTGPSSHRGQGLHGGGIRVPSRAGVARSPRLPPGCACIGPCFGAGVGWGGGLLPVTAGMSRGKPGAGLIPLETRGREEMQEEWHVILDCSLQACWLRMCKNNN